MCQGIKPNGLCVKRMKCRSSIFCHSTVVNDHLCWVIISRPAASILAYVGNNLPSNPNQWLCSSSLKKGGFGFSEPLKVSVWNPGLKQMCAPTLLDILPRRTLSTQNTAATHQLQPKTALSRSSAAAPRLGNHQAGAHSVPYKFNRWHGVPLHPSWCKQTALTSQCHV